MIQVRSLLLCTLLAAAGTAVPASVRAASGVVPKVSSARAGLAMPDLMRFGAGAAKVEPAARTLARKSGKRRGGRSERGSAGSGDATSGKARKGKTGDNSAGKESAAKSGESSSLDSLMADVVSEDKTTKGKKENSKEMDAILKDVQKAEPAPVAKKPPPAAAPPLSPTEISSAMGQLKVRGNACAHRAGRGGTAELKIAVSKEGRVTDVKVGGKLAGTPVATCIEQAARAITFRPNAGLRFDYRMDVR
jgi:hypothetical protein